MLIAIITSAIFEPPANLSSSIVVAHLTIIQTEPAQALTLGTWEMKRFRQALDVSWVPIAVVPAKDYGGHPFIEYNFPSTNWSSGDLFQISIRDLKVGDQPIPEIKLFGRLW